MTAPLPPPAEPPSIAPAPVAPPMINRSCVACESALSQVSRRNGLSAGPRLDSLQAQCNQCRALQPARTCHFAHLAGDARTWCCHETVVHHQGLSQGGRETVSG